MEEQRAVYLALIGAGLLPVAGAVVRRGAIGAGITICLILVAAGLWGLVSDSWRARHRRVVRLPAARSLDRPTKSQTR